MTRTSWRFITQRPEYFIAFGLGTGLSPKAPGTVGTLLGFPLYLGLAWALPLWAVLAILMGLYLAGIRICDQAGKAVGVADHPGIVWDEIVAMALVLCFTPRHWLWYLAAFVAFRFFDILKPWPIGLIDKGMENGAGVMLDDLVAAGYAIGALTLARGLL